MARVAHATSIARHSNQIAATSQPNDLDSNLRSELSGSSPSPQLPERVWAVAAPRATRSVISRPTATYADRTSLAQCVLVDSAILHDDDKVLVGVCHEIDILEGAAIDEQ